MDNKIKNVDIEEALKSLFNITETNNGESNSISNDGHGQNQYPESILQTSKKGNKLYNSFQSLSPQFLNTESNSNNRTQVIRWHNSNLETVQHLILGNWLEQNSASASTSKSPHDKSKATLSRRANKLFIWASSDEYIEERKKQLKRIRRGSELQDQTKTHITNDSDLNQTDENIKASRLQKKLKLKFDDQKSVNRLAHTIENESNKFIHSRIQKIRLHHSEQIEKQINERKKRDYEEYLRKLKLKEEEYEKSLRQDTANAGSKGNFFGNLFGFNATSTSNEKPDTIEPDIETSSIKNGSVNSSNKSKRSTLFGMQSLFSGGSNKDSSLSPKKQSTTVFDADDRSDTQSLTQSLAESNLDSILSNNKDNNSKKESLENEANINNSFEGLNIDDLENFRNRTNTPTKQNQIDYHKQDEEDNNDDEDDEFTEFTEATTAPKSISQNSKTNLSHNFFSIDHARQGSNSRNHEELIDLFDDRPPSKSSTPPIINSPVSPENEVNLLDL
ncbi:uncharacterized protein KGF55_002121 [Candida pseudojiufengensis]|uniref:uncharacterized protein n=1 Tax=Candida pseudojiufengensis TaxID=497109 RepID=UPI002225923D|nr:uncharacterized protein KGF55_002121 [Candida pseudojiufengensis]KAI5964179.1 hypothetical protein KGF55_002121 [Candida pseudojiufengensis]